METKLSTLWKDVLKDLETKTSKVHYHTLFKNTQLESFENAVATIIAPSTTVIDLLQKRFYEQIKASLDKHTEQSCTLLFVPKVISPEQAEKTGPLFASSSSDTDTPQTKPFIGHLPRVRADYTFANFAVSSSNQLAFVSASTVAENNGTSYNPFFIYGPVGVGKTHLMHAIANAVYQKTPERKIIYITSEEFTNEVIDAIRTNDTSRMKKKFRSAYLLLIDDIQFIEGKERVQEELFHTFNILIDSGAQICLSSDRPPEEIKKLEKRLSSRFAGGLTVDIDTPGLELKTAILGIKAQKYHTSLPNDVAMLLAEQVQDTRSLEGLLLRVITQAATSGEEITLSLARKALGAAAHEKRERLHPDDIIQAICEFYNIRPTQLKGPKRDASLVKARQICMYLLKNEIGLTYNEIGNILGGRDHTTIMHGVEKIEHSVENKTRVTEDILGIKKTLSG